jgi:hypothetical protein
MRLPGVVTQSILDTAKADYTTKRNAWVDSITTLLNSMRRVCFGRKEFVQDFSSASERYQTQILSQMYDEIEFDLKSPYLAADNRTVVCSGGG